MNESSQCDLRGWRYAYEAAFAVNLCFLARYASDETTGFLSRFDLVSIGTLHHYIDMHLYGEMRDLVPWEAVYVVAVIQAMILFAILATITKTAFIRKALSFVAGPVSVLALPALWLSIISPWSIQTLLPNPPHVWLSIEIAAAVALTTAYIISRRLLPGWSAITLAALHFALWGWLFLGNPYFWLNPPMCIFPVAGFISVVTWGLYLKSSPVTMSANPHPVSSLETS